MWSEDEETFLIHICDFKIFDMKVAPCEIQMALMAINLDNSICPWWQLSGSL